MRHTLLYIYALLFPVLSVAQEANGMLQETHLSLQQTPLSLQEKVRTFLSASPLGGMEGATSTVGIEIYDLTADTTLFAYNEHLMLRPASTMKLTTAIMALDILGGDYQFLTSLKLTPPTPITQHPSPIISLIGGMDPCFDSHDMQAFIDTLKALHIDTIQGAIVEDKILKDTLLLGSGWCWDDINPQLTPLLYNGKDIFLHSFLDSLKANNITVIDSPILQNNLNTPPLGGGGAFYCTRSHSIDQVLRPMLKNSNNLYAEALFYQLSPTNRRTPLFTGHTSPRPTAKLIAQTLDSLIHKNIYKGSLPTGRVGESLSFGRVADGSGLSLYNYQSADYQVRLLRYAYQHPEIYRHLYPALPIAGVDGTLAKRMINTPAEANVHAKTGTLTGVSSLAGYLTASNGHLLCFSIINQGCLNSKSARDFQDTLCVMLCE